MNGLQLEAWRNREGDYGCWNGSFVPQKRHCSTALIADRGSAVTAIERMVARLLAAVFRPKMAECAKGRFFDRVSEKLCLGCAEGFTSLCERIRIGCSRETVIRCEVGRVRLPIPNTASGSPAAWASRSPTCHRYPRPRPNKKDTCRSLSVTATMSAIIAASFYASESSFLIACITSSTLSRTSAKPFSS
jgi:hypothetical protein